MDIGIVRKRLEEMREELDRSISYLEGPEPRRAAVMEKDSADAARA